MERIGGFRNRCEEGKVSYLDSHENELISASATGSV